MMDILFLTMLVVFCALSWGFVFLCEKLTGGGR